MLKKLYLVVLGGLGILTAKAVFVFHLDIAFGSSLVCWGSYFKVRLHEVQAFGGCYLLYKRERYVRYIYVGKVRGVLVKDVPKLNLNAHENGLTTEIIFYLFHSNFYEVFRKP